MKIAYLILFSLLPLIHFSQPNTEVFLFDISLEGGAIKLLNGKNISNNEGYDNQPSFWNDNQVLFSSTREGQTDIVAYNVRDDLKTWINYTPDGSEYSPLKIPNRNEISAIRLDKDGKQLLYSYNIRNGESKVLDEDLVVGYHIWFDDQTIVSAVLDEGHLSLVSTHLKEHKNYKLQKKIGRSLHKIPNTNLISYISKENDAWEIKSLDPFSGATKLITKSLEGAEDMCWMINGTILMGKDDMIYKFNPKTDTQWMKAASLESLGITNISRITTNSLSNKLALVGEVSPVFIVQKQLEAYNQRDIDAFMATYTNDISLYNYPEQVISNGQQAMRDSYASFFEKTPDLKAVIKNRIVLGNKVIDQEEVTINGEIHNAVAIYEIENGLIKKVTFVR